MKEVCDICGHLVFEHKQDGCMCVSDDERDNGGPCACGKPFSDFIIHKKNLICVCGHMKSDHLFLEDHLNGKYKEGRCCYKPQADSFKLSCKCNKYIEVNFSYLVYKKILEQDKIIKENYNL